MRVQVAPSLVRIGIAAHNAVITATVVRGGRRAQCKWRLTDITGSGDLDISDVVAERNLKVLAKCPAFLYLQFSDLVRPSSSLIEPSDGDGDQGMEGALR